MSRSGERSPLVPLALGSAALFGALLISAVPVAPGPTRLAPGDTGDRLRIAGETDDPKLENDDVTAVVRRSDGALVDFFRSRAFVPTIDQLGTLTDIDGVWDLVPISYQFSTGTMSWPTTQRVTLRADAIEAVGAFTAGSARLEVSTLYRLDPSRPRLRIMSSFRVVSGVAPHDLGVGHSVRWGNVGYFVPGSRAPKSTFAGQARWVGRHGAGGDLLLRNQSDMWVQFSSKGPGFMGAVLALDRPGSALNAGHTLERELSYEDLPLPSTPPRPRQAGRILLKVHDEAGKPLAAKLRLQREGHREPLFPDQGGIDGTYQFVWTGNGVMDRELPAGKYRAILTSGIERNARRFKFELWPGSTKILAAELARVVPTPGYVSADLHLHQAPSVDADISLENRIVAVAAEGVEFAVATDHYVVTDFSPIVSELQREGILSVPLATMPGSEVSTVGQRFGHFNVFPLQVGQNVVYRDVTPTQLFADARAQSPNGVLQVNHPRWDPKLGYFTRYGVRVDNGEPTVAGYDPNFDTLEVYNGDDARDLALVMPVFNDWLHLLGRGHRYTATGNSDSHNLAFLDPGLPRNYIRHGASSDDASDVNAPHDAILRALKSGRVLVTSGPFIEANVAGKGPGETASGVGRKARLEIKVRAAPWITTSRLLVYEGSKGRELYDIRIYPSEKLVRYDGKLEITVDKPTFVVVMVKGDVPLPNVARDSTLPMAFSNPIWLEP